MLKKLRKLKIVRVYLSHFSSVDERIYLGAQRGSESTQFTTSWAGRIWIVSLPIFAAGINIFLGLRDRAWFSESEALLAGVSLMVGGLLALFAQMAAWRTRMVEDASGSTNSGRPKRDYLDSCVNHILAGVFSSTLCSLFLIIMSVSASNSEGVYRIGYFGEPLYACFSTLSVFFGVHILVCVYLVVSSCWEAYGSINGVWDHLRR